MNELKVLKPEEVKMQFGAKQKQNQNSHHTGPINK